MVGVFDVDTGRIRSEAAVENTAQTVRSAGRVLHDDLPLRGELFYFETGVCDGADDE